MFSPKQKIEIFEQLPFGVTNKTFFSFDQMFLEQDKPGIHFIKTDRSIFYPPSSQDDREHEIFETWYESIAGFDGVCGQPTICQKW